MEFSVQMVLPVGRTGPERPAALGEPVGISSKFLKTYVKDRTRELVFPIPGEKGRKAFRLGQHAVGSRVLPLAFLQIGFETCLRPAVLPSLHLSTQT